MKKSLISMAVFSVFAITGVQAQTVGATGNIIFDGSVTADTCKVTSGGGSSAGADLLVSMGSHSVETLGTETNPATSSGSLATVSKNIDLNVDCKVGQTVTMELVAAHTTNKGIAVTGGAQGVQIMLVGNGGQVLEFVGGKTDVPVLVNGGAAANGVTSFHAPLKAYYTLVNGTAAGAVTPGVANASVAYTLSYQ